MHLTISDNTKAHFKHALVSILVGAVVAFFTALFQGLLDYLKDGVFNFSGISAAIVYHFIKRPKPMA